MPVSSTGLTTLVAVGLEHDVERARPHRFENHGPVGTTFCVTLTPIFFHSSISQVPTILVGLIDVAVQQLELSAPRRRPPSAGAWLRRAISRCRARSRRSAAAHPWSRPAASPGRRCRRRSARSAILDRAGAPCHWSIARVSARRTRTSSNGFFLWLGVRMLPQFQSLSCTAILSPSSLTQLVARRRRQAAELDRGPIGAHRVDADRLLRREDAVEPVEIGLARVVIIGVAHALDRLADLVGDEFERARSP